MRQRSRASRSKGVEARTPASNALPSGTFLHDRYCVEGVLGSGGHSITYVGHDLKRVAKIVAKEYFPLNCATRMKTELPEVAPLAGSNTGDFHDGLECFLCEAQALVEIELSQSVVGPCDVFEQNGTAYMVSPYIEGTTFVQRAKERKSSAEPAELLHVVRPLYSALATLHDSGFLHRDISPGNLILHDGRVRLVDLDCGQNRIKSSRTAAVMLKCGYAPIEQYARQREGPWTDIYSLCASIYHCLTGVAPPPALDRVTRDELVAPHVLGVNIPAWQERALLRGMRTKPSQRFANVCQLEAALYR